MAAMERRVGTFVRLFQPRKGRAETCRGRGPTALSSADGLPPDGVLTEACGHAFSRTVIYVEYLQPWPDASHYHYQRSTV